jgi:hypothetical protein
MLSLFGKVTDAVHETRKISEKRPMLIVGRLLAAVNANLIG